MSEYINKTDSLFLDKLNKLLNEDQVRINERMKDHTTFKIGGPCDYFLTPSSLDELSQLLVLCKEHKIEVFVLGNGSNLLVTDKGYRGAVIQVFKNFNQVTIEGNTIIAGAGILLVALASVAAKGKLTGLEFASGIPGTLGGAVYMNAGAYGGEMKQVVTKVTAINLNGEVKVFNRNELDFDYRHSALQDKHFIAIEVELELKEGDIKSIKELMFDFNSRRKDKQPLEFPSAGSTFKRPEGYYAGKLIMDSGLKGYRIGDAMVSDKHCGFVVNNGDATFNEVYELIQHIQKTVFEQYGVTLQREVKILGDI
jgi:UDP-N-acetylmuramate dehydrogenase